MQINGPEERGKYWARSFNLPSEIGKIKWGWLEVSSVDLNVTQIVSVETARMQLWNKKLKDRTGQVLMHIESDA